MRSVVLFFAAALIVAGYAYGQNQSTPYSPANSQAPASQSSEVKSSQHSQVPSQTVRQGQTPSAGQDVGHGAGDIGRGAGGAAGNVAKGTGKGAAQLVTLHPISAAGSVGKGAGRGGKDLAVGTGKGVGKVFKGTGRAIKHIF